MEFREEEMRKNYTLSGAVLPLELLQRELPPLFLDNPHLTANTETYSSESLKVGMSSTSKINKLKVFCFVFHNVVLRARFDIFHKNFTTVSGIQTNDFFFFPFFTYHVDIWQFF